MNKLIAKLAKVFLGLSLAVGVGVAVGNKKSVSVNAATESDNLVLSGVSGTSGDIVKDSTKVATFSAPDRTTSGQQWRLAANKTMTFTPASGYVLNSVYFKTNSTASYMPRGTYVADGGSSKTFNLTSGTTGSISSLSVTSSIVLTVTSAARITEVAVTYSESGAGEDITSYTSIVAGSYNIVFRLNNSTTDYYMTTTLDGSSRFTTSTTAADAGVFTFESTGTANEWYVSYDNAGTKTYLRPGTSNGATVRSTSSSGMGMTACEATNGNIGLKTTGTSNYLERNGTASNNYVGRYTGTQRDIHRLIPASTTFTVTFNVQGHGTAPATQTIADGGKVTQPTAPTATGWTFGGWYKEQACTNAWDFSNDTISEATTLYAKWTQNKYTVYWKNYNGSTLETDTNVVHGTTPTYDSATPTRDADDQYTYTFSGWSPAVGAVTANTTYTAQYSTTVNTYTVYWKNYNGTVLETDTEVPYGTTPTYNGSTPTKADTAQYHYTFTGWSPSVGPITGETNYVAQFSEDVNTFSVTAVISHGGLDNYNDIEYDGDLLVTIVPESISYGFPESVTVEMGGVDVTSDVIYDSTDGSIMMEHVTDSIVITATCPSLATYSIDYSGITNGSATGDTVIRQAIGSQAEITISTNGHSHLPQSVIVKSNDVTLTDVVDYIYDSSDGSLLLTVTANYTGNIVITATCVAYEQYDVSLSLNGATRTSGPSGVNAIEEGETNSTWVFKAVTDYVLPNTISVVSYGNTLVSGTDYTWTKATGTLVIPAVTGDLEIIVQADAKALESISLSSTSGSYTLGDTLENVEVTAHFNTGATAIVTSSTEISGSCIDSDTKMLIQQGTNSPITFSYTFENVTKTETYYATVGKVTPKDAYIGKVTDASTLQLNDRIVLVNESASVAMTTTSPASGTLGVSSVTISNNKITSELDSSVAILTLSGGNSSSGWELTNDDKYLYVPNNNTRGTVLRTTEATNVISISSGDATIKASSSATGTLQFNNSANPKRFSNYTSSQQTVQIYKIFDAVEESLIRITAELKTGTYYQLSTVTSDDFTVTAYYDDATSETVTNDITVTNGYLANLGNNTVTVSYGGKSFNVNVNAVEQTAVFTGLSWAQGEYTIIDGQSIDFSQFGTITAEYDNGESPSVDKDVEHCSVSIYTKNGNSYTKVSDISDGATITSSSHGKYLGVTYTETNTFTAYSSAPIYVVEEIESVYHKVETYSWTKVSSIAVGDIVALTGTKADGTSPYEMSGVSSADNIGTATAFESSPAGTYMLEVVAGANAGQFAFKDSNDNYLSYHSDKKLTVSDTLDSDSSWTVEFDSEEPTKAVVTSVSSGDPLQYNPGSRFCVYHSASQQPIQFYKGEKGYSSEGSDIANTNARVQKAVLEYAVQFNETMACTQNGSTVNVSTKWSTLSTSFTALLNGFTGTDLVHCKALFQGADAVDGGDTLQDMLARYEYICAKYKLGDFLHTETDRPEVQRSAAISPLTLIGLNGENANTIAVIVIISMVSVTAIGGYFFLRKRKENI